MTAPANARIDFASLDQQIARALDALRLARDVAGQGETRTRADTTRVSEDNLNALLDYRITARRQ